ncbi:MAG: NADH-quinone oxidoreductase subunit C [Raineya sp.]|nr:NADH-quinone oxidoreductase subunit C [Raineya sp.]
MAVLTREIVLEDILQKFEGSLFLDTQTHSDLPLLVCERETIVNLLEYLYFHKQFQFQFLTTLCGIHYPDNVGKEFAVMYQIHSLIHNIRLRIKVFLSESDLHIPTITHLFAAANWMEREAYDFYGIIFDGHPNLKRIYNVEEMDYHPLRKEYPLEDQTRRDKENLYFGR